MAVEPTKGSCTFAMAFQIERGSYGTVPLDGLGFIVLGWTPEAMGKGNWSVGVIADERASAEQRDAITAIASGAAGGPMAALSGLVGKFLGVESAPIRFDRTGAKWSVTAAKLVDMAAEGAMGIDPSITEPIHLDNTGHPAASRFALARASKSHVRRARAELGRRERKEQRPVRALLLAKCVARHRSPAPSRRDRALISGCIVLITALAWAYLVHLIVRCRRPIEARHDDGGDGHGR